MPCFYRRKRVNSFVSPNEKQMELDGKLERDGKGSLLLWFHVNHKVAYQKSGSPTVERAFCFDGSTFQCCQCCHNRGNWPVGNASVALAGNCCHSWCHKITFTSYFNFFFKSNNCPKKQEAESTAYDKPKIHDIKRCLVAECDFGLKLNHNSMLYCGIFHCTPETLDQLPR